MNENFAYCLVKVSSINKICTFVKLLKSASLVTIKTWIIIIKVDNNTNYFTTFMFYLLNARKKYCFINLCKDGTVNLVYKTCKGLNFVLYGQELVNQYWNSFKKTICELVTICSAIYNDLINSKTISLYPISDNVYNKELGYLLSVHCNSC